MDDAGSTDSSCTKQSSYDHFSGVETELQDLKISFSRDDGLESKEKNGKSNHMETASVTNDSAYVTTDGTICSPLVDPTDNSEVLDSYHNNNNSQSDVNLLGKELQKKSKFRNSVNTNWISSMKRKKKLPIHSNFSNLEHYKKSSKGFLFPKTSKRLSIGTNSFIPKRFFVNQSNTEQRNTFQEGEILNPSCSVGSSTAEPSREPSRSPKNLTIPKQLSSKLQTSPLLSSTTPSTSDQNISSKQNLERGTSTNSSIPSEKGTIGKSLNALKRTTKSILFLDSNSSLINTALKKSEDSPKSEQICTIRRSLSYTESDRKQIMEFILNDSNGPGKGIHRRSISRDMHPPTDIVSTGSSQNSNTCSSTTPQSFTNFAKNHRQRSKTLDASENPLLELTNNSGLLSSIASFVKINRAPTLVPMHQKNQSFAFHLPKFDNIPPVENEIPEEFLERLLTIYPITMISEVLSLEDNEMLKRTLQEYLRKFYDFSNIPLDMALRQFLMINYLPKETQQIDRVVYQFAKFYHQQHLDLGYDRDTIYILTYSLIMVHTDKFNPNNKRKMSRFEFVRNVLSAIENNVNYSISSSNELTHLILKELLGYYFDNITYCPLIKIAPEQSSLALEALTSRTMSLPYPQISFLNASSPYSKTTENDHRKSVSSNGKMNSSNSISSLNKISAQELSLPMQPPLRKKSSSFLWSSAHTILDPYDYLISNNKELHEELKLLATANDVKISCRNPFIATNTSSFKLRENIGAPSIEMIETQLKKFVEDMDDDLEPSLLENIWKSLTSDKVEFVLNIPKSKGGYLLTDKSSMRALNESEGEEHYLIRVIKVGMIDKQEVTTSSATLNKATIPVPIPDSTDMSTMDENTKPFTRLLSKAPKIKIWKRNFCILTSVGMFFYEDVSLFRMRFCGVDSRDGTNMVIIEEASSKAKSLVSTSADSYSDLNGFMSFPYFRSENKTEKSEAEKMKTESMEPTACITEGLFATRKLQNIEYDATVNDINLEHSQEPSLKNFTGTAGLNEIGAAAKLCQSDDTDAESGDNSTSGNTEDEISKIPNSAKYTFFIYGKGSKNLYMVSTETELKSWINSINIASVLKHVQIKSKPLDYSIIHNDQTNKISNDIKYFEISPVRDIPTSKKFKANPYDFSPKDCRDETEASDMSSPRNRSNTTFIGEHKKLLKDIDIETELGIAMKDVSDSSSRSDYTCSTKEHDDESDYKTARDYSHGKITENIMYRLGSPFTGFSKEDTNTATNESPGQKADSLEESNASATHPHNILLEHLYCVERLSLVMPLDSKTKDYLLSTAKILGIKLEWLWYEKCRECAVSLIYRRIVDTSDIERREVNE